MLELYDNPSGGFSHGVKKKKERLIFAHTDGGRRSRVGRR